MEKLVSKFRNYHYRSIATVHNDAKLMPAINIVNLLNSPESISIGKSSVVAGELLVFAHSGKIEIGECSYIGDGSKIWSAENIKIGDRVLISYNVNIHDSDSHPIDSQERHIHFLQITGSGHPKQDINIKASSIIIEDDVWIGFNATILKGVTIGKGAIIGACSVVTKDVPSATIVAGNPANFIRKIDYNENI